ncbi:corticosteroid 11-beta-dehydrogenase isozyme 2-like [Pollicipes pollicipes]|uniref:corticosteroid 11-beta-dehydrogenase isozyme 2-like n=1 Tax=Pollicipes pollicipes TaxID=41117 RepID=UPI001884D37E|nr:corticosteroid 11-beta-dehydrogenase isozyme 2-like [Pollicipes pollicipes]
MEHDLILVVSAQVLVIGAVAVGIGVLLLRNLVCRSRIKARGRAVLVTGCDRGVGFELARHLDALGFRVFAGVLDPCGAGAARLQGCTSVLTQLLDLDVTCERKVAAATAQVRDALRVSGEATPRELQRRVTGPCPRPWPARGTLRALKGGEA